MRCTCFVIAVLCGSIAAQQTWIVDVNGSGNFTSLAPAIAAASPGDILLIRPGHYGVVSLNKQLSLLADRSATAQVQLDQLAVVNPATPAGQITIGGLVIDELDCTSVSVPIAIDSVTSHRASFTGCRSVNANWLGVDQATRVTSTIAVFSQCDLIGSNGGCHQQSWPGVPALYVDGDVTIAGGQLIGGSGGYGTNCGNIAAASAIYLHSGSARVTHCSLFGGSGPGGWVAQIVSGSLYMDPSNTFYPTPVISGGTAVSVVLPAMSGTSAPPGGAMTWRLDGAPGIPALLAGSVGVGTPTAIPEGILWLQPVTMTVLWMGTTDAQGMFRGSLPVPPLVGRGLLITLQAAVLPTGAPLLAASTPVTLLVY
jgi:hypothetical protein